MHRVVKFYATIRTAELRPRNRKEAMAFMGFALSDEAQRPSMRGRRQKLQLAGRDVSYGVRVQQRRGSDRSERIYVAVTALQSSGFSNDEACREVAERWQFKLGRSRRGRPRTITRPRDFVDKVETIRSTYNAFKKRHPWKEQLPQHDAVFEQWCWRFHQFEQWATEKILVALRAGRSGEDLAEDLLDERGTGGRLNYRAMTSLGEEWLLAGVKSSVLLTSNPDVSPVRIRKFIKAFVGVAPMPLP